MSTSVFKKKKPKIVFWDDDAEKEDEKQLLFTEIKNGLESYGWSPYIFTNKEDAKKAALERDVDAVVLDLKEGDKIVGIDILRYLRKERPFLPIVMFTIYDDVTYIQSAFKEDASYYLTVPIKSYHDIIRAIEVAVERESAKERFTHEQYFASIGKLAAGVAHFIKNSLWAISGRSQYLLKKTDKTNEFYKMYETINRRCDDANKVVMNLLNFASREPQKNEKKEVNVADIVKNVLSLVSFECEYFGIYEKRNIMKKNSAVLANEFELKEAFLNIVKNAIEAMPEGGNLSVEVNSEKNNIIITISDTGVGMSEDVLNNLFFPYYTTKDNSAGFGLFDTRRIIHNHNGTIKVDSKPGEGTEVRVTFPGAAVK